MRHTHKPKKEPSPAGQLLAALIVGATIWFAGHVWEGTQDSCEQRVADGVAGPICSGAVER
ncbi:MAG: hypothetical protein AAFO29_22265 [Actinomycetota bacterium]